MYDIFFLSKQRFKLLFNRKNSVYFDVVYGVFVFSTPERIVSANTVGRGVRQGVRHDSTKNKLYDIL